MQNGVRAYFQNLASDSGLKALREAMAPQVNNPSLTRSKGFEMGCKFGKIKLVPRS